MPNNEYENEPNQSRSEDIISSILDGTEYDEPARSRIEYLLIQLKEAIEGGGGGGGVTSYSPLTEKPKIDNHILQAGNNTSSDLGLQTKIDADHKLSADNVDDTNTTNKFNVKSDWNATSGASSEILNKPNLGTASAKNVPVSGDAATGEVVLGSDTRLTDARNAKDVYNWAKQSTKPTYNYSEIQNTPTIPDELSDLIEDSTHRTVTDAEKGTWSGKQNALTFDDAPTASSNNPVKSGGVYTALAGKQNSLSEAQMDAVNSGATAAKISKIATNENNISRCYTLDIGTRLTNDSDKNLNNYKTIGVYSTALPSSSFTNCPPEADPIRGFRLLVMQDNPTNLCQIYDEFWTAKRWLRPCTAAGVYQSWVLVDDDLDAIKNNISYIADKGEKNLIPYPYAQGNPYTQNGITYSADYNGIIHVAGTISGNNSYYDMILTADPKPILQDGEQYILFIHATGTGKVSQFYINEVTSGGSNLLININNLVAGDYVETINFSKSENSNGISCIIKNATSNTNPIDMYLSIMICKKSDWDISHTYQPYAMSNVELTAKEQQNENNISTEQAKTIGMSTGGSDYITINGIRFYVSNTTPTGTIPVGSIGVGF